jgi:hypothetical protein
MQSIFFDVQPNKNKMAYWQILWTIQILYMNL